MFTNIIENSSCSEIKTLLGSMKDYLRSVPLSLIKKYNYFENSIIIIIMIERMEQTSKIVTGYFSVIIKIILRK